MENKIQLNPAFQGLDAETIKNAVESKRSIGFKTIDKTEALKLLLKQAEPVDFLTLKYPEVEKLRKRLENCDDENEAKKIQRQIDGLVLKRDDYVFDVIKEIQRLANDNSLGLCLNNQLVYLYNGAFWDLLDKSQFYKFLCDIAEKMGLPERIAHFHRFQKELISQFETVASIPTPEINSDIVLINLRNGTYEINGNGETRLRPPRKEDFITYQLPFNYDPNATAPKFNKYLNEVLPDVELQRLVSEYIGYLFIRNGTNNLKLEKVMILYGNGQNGKSVLLDIIGALIGPENCTNISLENLTEPKGFYRAALNNKLVNYSTEISGNFDVSLFKKMVSGEPVEACRKFEQPFTMTQYAKFIFSGNELPKNVEHTDAYYRRFLIISFDVKISEEQKDINLAKNIINDELPGIFNWTLEGLKRLIKNKKFSNCKASEDILKKYEMESNSVEMFIEDNNYKLSDGSDYVRLNVLFENYKAYCINEGRQPFNKTNFRKQLERLGIVADKNREGNIYYLKGGPDSINPY